MSNKMNVPLFRPWVGEEEARAVAEVIKSDQLVAGPIVEQFENEFAKTMRVQYAIAVNSGSSALLVAMKAMGVGNDNEVITPDMTFVSTASAALYLGARPVFSDIELKYYCIDPQNLAEKITDKTKLIVPVHYAGHTAEMDEIMKIAREHNLLVLEDAAQAHYADYKGVKAGAIGDAGIFSFTPPKVITTGEGGMITTNNKDIADKARLVRNFYETRKFVWEGHGFNFRMPEAMGAMGRVQLKKLVPAIKRREEIATMYNNLLDQEYIITPTRRTEKDGNYQLYTIRLRETVRLTRDEVMRQLADQGVSTRLYFPTLHHQKVFADVSNGSDKDFPNAVTFRETAFSLPIYVTMKDEEVRYVAENVNKVVNGLL